MLAISFLMDMGFLFLFEGQKYGSFLGIRCMREKNKNCVNFNQYIYIYIYIVEEKTLNDFGYHWFHAQTENNHQAPTNK